MFSDHDALATIAVKKLDVAAKFYEGTLGLRRAPGADEQGVATYESGKTKLLVYESRYAGTNQATAATWIIREKIEDVVAALKAKGVVFEHYDFPGAKHEGDLHVFGSIKNAWFKDPDGNILSIVSG
jgi:catechol 2,3-dioxygenase-like lactoylglutathione lyase family enzyme